MYGNPSRRLSLPLLCGLERSHATLLATRGLASNQPLVERGEWLLPPSAARAHLPMRGVHIPTSSLESRGRRGVPLARPASGSLPNAPGGPLSSAGSSSTEG